MRVIAPPGAQQQLFASLTLHQPTAHPRTVLTLPLLLLLSKMCTRSLRCLRKSYNLFQCSVGHYIESARISTKGVAKPYKSWPAFLPQALPEMSPRA